MLFRSVNQSGPAVLATPSETFFLALDTAVIPEKSGTLKIHGVPIIIDSKNKTLTCQNVTAPMEMNCGRGGFYAIIDRGSIEIFIGSTVAMSIGVDTTAGPRTLEWTADEQGLVKGTLIPLESIWKK